MFAKIENGVVAKYPILNIRTELPNVSFPSDIRQANLPTGYMVVERTAAPQYNPATHKIVESAPAVDGNRVVVGYDVVALTAEEVQANSDALAASARETRNEMLTASDWTQVADAPVDQAAWAAYRQALRDVTAQAGFPLSIDWPEQP